MRAQWAAGGSKVRGIDCAGVHGAARHGMAACKGITCAAAVEAAVSGRTEHSDAFHGLQSKLHALQSRAHTS